MNTRISTKGLLTVSGIVSGVIVFGFVMFVLVGIALGPDFDIPWSWFVGVSVFGIGLWRGFKEQSLPDTVFAAVASVVGLFALAFLSTPWRSKGSPGFPLEGFAYFGVGAAICAAAGVLLGDGVRAVLAKSRAR
jgi:peptidoglycan/LPS O-acetylase OafA/YrhL